MEKHRQNIDSSNSDKLLSLANQIFSAFPQEVTGLKFYVLDCGCIYYQRVFRDGNLDPQIGIYRNAENGPCEVCMPQKETWKDRLVNKTVIHIRSNSMKAKRQFTMILLVLATFIISMVFSSQQLMIRSVFAQKEKAEETVSELGTLNEKISIMGKKVEAVEKQIERYKSEVCAAEKLIEISEKNLVAPTFFVQVLTFLFMVLSAVLSVIIYFVRRGLIQNIDRLSAEMTERSDRMHDSINSRMTEIENENFHLFAVNYDAAAVKEWQRGRPHFSVKFSEKAVSYAEKVWTKEPEDESDKSTLNTYRSNLGYFYVESGRTDKAGDAIDFAKMGLETGINTKDLNLIDNYLYVVMRFSELPKDKEKWLVIFNTYKDKLYEAGVREEEEQKEYNDYYEKIEKGA